VPKYISIYLKGDTTLSVEVEMNVVNVDSATLGGSGVDKNDIKEFPEGHDDLIFTGKKVESEDFDGMTANKSTNNARQAFHKFVSLNIWESDNAGLQLDIGGRGLSPKRSANFNMRQNEYDMSADALGYPESYYSPSFQGVKSVEIIRGAGALQYGSQFGGMVNFYMKEGDTSKAVNFESQNTYGAFNFFGTYNALHGQVKNLNYYTFVHYKRGDGWRDNSNFNQLSAYGGFHYDVSDKFHVNLELTHMNYLSRQPGGLTDEQFEADPLSSNRERNWFTVNWNIAAMLLKYEFSDSLKLYSRTFGLHAGRTSLGLLETPDLEDPQSNRDLIDGKFRNIGNETKLKYEYRCFKDSVGTLLIGSRLFRGYTNFSQSFGTDGSDADFTKVDTSFLDRRKSDFEFPNFNAAFFVENVLPIGKLFTLTTGLRYEYIKTHSEGFFTNSIRLNSFGDFKEETITDTSDANRHILLYGLGFSRDLLFGSFELYGNATTNYRAINFTDVQIQTNTQLVDTLIQDESGYTLDLGVRSKKYYSLFVDAGLFYINYKNRIGEVIDDGLRVRTNIGSARIYGVELYMEWDLLKQFAKDSLNGKGLSVFVNGSLNNGVYTDINERASAGVRSGNRLEDIPEYNIKTGLMYKSNRFSIALQATFIGDQFSDAANTTDAYKGVFGPIPAYSVWDFSAKYKVNNNINLSFSMNNVLNRMYFTRRAVAYPGPGIIPALGRNWDVTLGVKL